MTLQNIFILQLIILLMMDGITGNLNLSSNASWDQSGITIAGNANGTNGSSLYELYRPVGISVTSNGVLYISDTENNRIVVVQLDSTNDVSIIGSGLGSAINQFSFPFDLFTTDTTLYVNDYGNVRVKESSLNGSDPTVMFSSGFNALFYLYVDNSNNLYFTEHTQHSVLLFRANTTNGVIVAGAGTGTSGSNANQLDSPYGLFVNDVGIIYIADCSNHRIMKWLPGSLSGTLVAGNGTAGTNANQLNSPTDVIVDINEYLYISESSNSRITRWRSNALFGECIAACTGTSGTAPTQLYGPHSLAFDSSGSIYVSDWGNNRVQKFRILQYTNPSYNQPKFSPCATWEPNGITFLNSSILGTRPYGLFINKNNTIYVAIYDFHNVQVWLENSTTPIRTISGGLSYPSSVFVTDNGDVYVDNGVSNHRVNKWTLNATNSTNSMYVSGPCGGLFLDVYQNLYCSIGAIHSVIKKSFGDDINNTKVVAGNGNAGSASNMLNGPLGIFVDIKLNLYVADCYNNRIQAFQSKQLNGTTVAGNGASGTITLLYPTDVIIDADGYLFIADSYHNRIVGAGPLGFRCIIGCTSFAGSASNQLNQPQTINFDSYGNLFVVDMINVRVQKFLLTNNICPTSYNRPKFCSNATWDTNAITFLDSKTLGSEPQGIFINTNNTVYTVTQHLGDVFVTTEQGNTSVLNTSDTSKSRYSLFVTRNDDIYMDSGAVEKRIEQWISNTTSVVVVVTNLTDKCWSLFVDVNNIIYCSQDNQHQVIKISLHNVTTAAGNGTSGSESHMLYSPKGIFVDSKFQLYVADCGNNRVQRFTSDQLNGTTVVGNGSNNTIMLDCPSGIFLDADEYLFIVDSNNHRIIGSSFEGFRCLVGCSKPAGGLGPDELNYPQQLSFDSYGNIFVTDTSNDRIQEFFFDPNSCNQITTLQDVSTTNAIQSTVMSTLSLTTTISSNVQSSLSTCSNSTNIGLYCNMSSSACDILQPCQYSGTCHDINTTQNGFICACQAGFNGSLCQFDHRLCKPNTCWNNGICNETSTTTMICTCAMGWTGVYCEKKMDYCQNIRCKNNGVCRSLLLNYTCECLSDSYSGRQCEVINNKIVLKQILAKSVAYIAILAMIVVAIFIFVMDVLKYGFGIDPIAADLRRKKKVKKRRTPVLIRYIYVHSTPPQITIDSISVANETV